MGFEVSVFAFALVEHRTVGNGEMGEITRQLRDLYFGATSGRIEKYRHWLTPVYVEEITKA